MTNKHIGRSQHQGWKWDSMKPYCHFNNTAGFCILSLSDYMKTCTTALSQEVWL